MAEKSQASQAMREFRSPLRKKAKRLYRLYRAILIFTNQLNSEDRRIVDLNATQIAKLPKRKLQELVPALETEVRSLKRRFGMRADLGELEELIEGASDSETSMLYVNKVALETLFTSYEKVFPELADFPPHTRIGIDLHGLVEREKIEIFLLEATLFEDMASLWNLTLETGTKYRRPLDKVAFKRTLALTRATAKAAFNFIEGYLNGLAMDVLLTQAVSDDEQTKLQEWDPKRSRKRFLSLRDKLLQYPKIATGAAHPPLDEGNCREIKAILELEQQIRHALIHPTPQVPPIPDEHIRESTFHGLSVDRVGILCDEVVELVFKLNWQIAEKYGPVAKWLCRREESGKFPHSAFT